MLALLLLLACRTPEVCPRASASGAPAMGDVNGDGDVDLSDAAALRRNLLFGGRAPACDAAADTMPLGVPDASGRLVDLADAAAILHNRFAGSSDFPELADGACDAWTAWPEGACGRMAWSIDAPRKVRASTFEARITLSSPDLRVEGWSLSVAAEGCRVVDATLAGTAGADARDSSSGARKGGFNAVDLTDDGGAVAAVLLGWLVDATASAGDQDLLVLTVEGEGEGCNPCRLSLHDGGVGRGEPVSNVVTVDGRSYQPELAEAKIKVCR